ncbi:hypothetical protein [Nitrosomonas halophila]|uniref:hypothetical protein n=1 Tax=Nitrosomonas halophila TaxID=44576 RepID=UPI0015A4536A|nr:hypothetical protein [Nitrosomonas halophila]
MSFHQQNLRGKQIRCEAERHSKPRYYTESDLLRGPPETKWAVAFVAAFIVAKLPKGRQFNSLPPEQPSGVGGGISSRRPEAQPANAARILWVYFISQV